MVDSTFTFFLAANVTDLTRTSKASPYAHFSDGCLDLLWMDEKSKKGDVLSVLLKLADGSFVRNRKMEYRKVKAFALQPIAAKQKKGIFSVDGELFKPKPILVECHRGLLRFIARA